MSKIYETVTFSPYNEDETNKKCEKLRKEGYHFYDMVTNGFDGFYGYYIYEKDDESTKE